MKKRRLTKGMALILLLLVQGCTGPTINRTNAATFVDDLWGGRIVLNRDNPVALPSPWELQYLKDLWTRQDWPKLAGAVTEDGYDEDLLWFYLGEATRSSGNQHAALIYYRMAVENSLTSDHNRQCARFSNLVLGTYFDACSGFVFPRDALLKIQAASVSEER